MTDDSRHLLERLEAGDSGAATTIHNRYVERLIALARQRLSQKLAARLDPEDIVQSAYRSFFVRAQRGDFVLRRAGDLWRLLASIAVHKLQRRVEHHSSIKRSVNSETAPNPNDAGVSREPTAEEVAEAIELLERFMASRNTLERQVIEMRLQGESTDAIAQQINRTERTVRRVLESLRLEMESRFADQ
jgi:RNA polymerase sigma factor (sigma-70 family)